MGKSMMITLVKFIGACGLLLVIMSIKRNRTVIAEQPITHHTAGFVVSKPHMTKKSKAAYAKNVAHYDVTFFSRKNDHSTDMIARKGLLTLRKNAKGIILICHGYMCNKDDVNFLRTLFPEYHCMSFDFRAHGEHKSEQFCTLGKHESYDVIAAAQFLRQHPRLKNLKLFGYGFSMGAVSLIEAQAKAQIFDAMILDCPFDSSASVLDRVLSKMQVNLCGYSFDMPGRTLLQKYAFHPYVEPLVRGLIKSVAYVETVDIDTHLAEVSPIHVAKKITVPCYFIHCINDEKVSVTAAKNLYEQVGSSFKRLWLTQGRKHFDSYFYHPEKYAYRTNKFLEQVLSGNTSKIPAQKIYEDCTVHASAC